EPGRIGAAQSAQPLLREVRQVHTGGEHSRVTGDTSQRLRIGIVHPSRQCRSIRTQLTRHSSQSIRKIFHDADYHLRLIQHQFGYSTRNLFDTRIAAQLLGEPSIGLGALLELYFGLKPDKRFQRADWSSRPLTAPMLEYAAGDT